MKRSVEEKRLSMRKWIILLGIVVLAGCGAQQSSTPSYEETKKMITDTMQTEEGKKVMRQMLSDPEFKELLILEQEDVKNSIENTLLSKDAEKFWKDTFKDPTFSETFAKSMKKQQQDVMTALMKDASFQKELETFFGSPDMQKQMEKILQSSTNRKEIEKIVQETIDSPLLKAKWVELIKAAGTTEEQGKSPSKDSSGGGGGEGNKPE